LEICPIAPEYTIKDGAAPVLLAEDGRAIYDVGLGKVIRGAAQRRDIDLQLAVINGFASDGSTTVKNGHVPRAACLGFPTLNTHGYEIAHLAAIRNCAEILKEVCAGPIT
jgi:putative aminopeptidase FrvX